LYGFVVPRYGFVVPRHAGIGGQQAVGAADVIANSGLANTTIEDIATASGVPKATLYYYYYYFTGKEDILSFLLRDSLAVLAGEVAHAADSPGPGRDRLVRSSHEGADRGTP
jgi:AcrR family transcriptional regulator